MSLALNPVVLISGAATGVGDACARALASQATGGLLLADADEAGLAAAADALENAPERVSTLAFDPRDEHRWSQACDFVQGQYGRLDWALLHADLATMLISVRALLPIMRANTGGGVILLIGAAADITGDPDGVNLMRVMRVAAKEAARDKVRVNALALASGTDDLGRSLPAFDDLVREQGGPRQALAKLTRLSPPLARTTSDDLSAPILTLLGQAAAVSGVALLSEGFYTL